MRIYPFPQNKLDENENSRRKSETEDASLGTI